MLRDHRERPDFRHTGQLVTQRFRQIGHLSEVACALLVNPSVKLGRAKTLLAQTAAKGRKPFEIEIEKVRGHR